MKRTPLTRRTPLKRGGWLRRRRKPVPVIVADIWREGLGPCAVCGARFRVDGHHIIPKRILRALGFDALCMDKRNRLPLCRRHHERHEASVEPVPRELLPASVWEFADEIGLRWYVERHYKPGEEAAVA